MNKEDQNIELPNMAVKPVEEPVQQPLAEQPVSETQPVQQTQPEPVQQQVEQPAQPEVPVQSVGQNPVPPVEQSSVQQPSVPNESVQQNLSAGQVYVAAGNPVNQATPNMGTGTTKTNEVVDKAKQGLGNYVEKLKTDKKVLGISIAVVVILLLVICSVYLNGGSKGVAKSFSQAFVKSDTKKIVKLMHKNYLDAYEDMGFDIEDTLDDTFDEYDNDDYKVLSYEIVDSDKVEKSDLEDLAEDLDDNCDIDEKSVKAAVVYTIKFKVNDDGDKDTMKKDVTAVKIKGKWYIFLGDLS